MILTHPILLSVYVLASSTVNALFIPQASPIKIPFYTKETRMTKRDGSSTSLTSFTDGLYYYADVQVGTPPQKLELVLDTGSSDLYVNSRGCSKNICPFTLFDETASSTYVPSNNDTFSIMYGVPPITAYVNGSYGFDTFTMGGITVKNQKFGRAYNQSVMHIVALDPDYAHSDGILGLGFPDLTSSDNGPYNPLLFSMFQQGSFPAPIFSWSYGKEFVTSRIEGELMLGGTDPSKYTGDIHYVPVLGYKNSQNRYWQSYIQGVGVYGDGGSSNVSFVNGKSNSKRVIFDTGTPLTMFPTSVVKSMYTDLTGKAPTNSTGGGAPMYAIDCNVALSNKRVHLNLSRNGSNSTVDDHPLIIDVPVSSLMFPVDDIDFNKAKECYLAIQYSDNLDFFLLGQTLLHNLYLSFDFGNNQTGFAVPVNSTTKVYTL